MIYVIIPIHNRPEYSRICLYSLYSVNHGIPITPIIVNNGSRKKTSDLINEWGLKRDELPEEQKKLVLEPKIVTLPFNSGFAGGLNAGLRQIENLQSHHVVVFHNDCVPFDGWIKEMFECLETNDDDVFAITPRTSLANEGTPVFEEIKKRFEPMKFSNKDRVSSEEIESLLGKLYLDRSVVLEDLKKTYPMRTSYSPEICSFCFLTKGEFFIKYGKDVPSGIFFDEDFWPRGYEDRFFFIFPEREGFVNLIANYAYVHHFNNISSDQNGFCQPDSMRLNLEKFKHKVLERDLQMGELMKAKNLATESPKTDGMIQP